MTNMYSGELFAAEPFKTNLIPVEKVKIENALFSINPVDMNTKTVLSVYIKEETIYIRPTV